MYLHPMDAKVQECFFCGLGVESVSHFNIHSTLLNELQSIAINLLNQEDDVVALWKYYI